MASVQECRAAIDRVSGRIMGIDAADRQEHLVERTVSIWAKDLDTVFDMRLTQSGLTDVTDRPSAAPAAKAQVRITTTSDDLVALAEERMDFGKAFLSGRVKVNASFGDLLRIRRLL